MSTAIGGEVFVGSKCHGRIARALISDWLTYEQNRGRAAWYDGLHFYRYNPKNGCGGKYLALREVTGEKDHKLNPLSKEGFLKHFEPCEFTSYNLSALELHSFLQENNAERDRVLKEQSAQRETELKGERREINELEKVIQEWIDCNSDLRTTNQVIEVSTQDGTKKKIRATCYSVSRDSPPILAIHRPIGQTRKWDVTHIPSGMGISFEFSQRKDALRYVRGIINIMDHSQWASITILQEKTIRDFCQSMLRICGRKYYSLNDMRELVVLINARKDGRV